MDIFIVQNNIVVPTAHALLLTPFKNIWESDDSPKKDIAMAKFSYIEFMCSYKKSNPFIGYTDKNQRKLKILS